MGGSGRARVGARRIGVISLACALTVPAIRDGRAADEASNAGKAQFVTSCGTCHTAGKGEPHRQGPNLFGVVGRQAGTSADFKYSPALKAGGWAWDEASLDAWITDAQTYKPGSVMNYRQRDPEKRKIIIAFLKTLSETK